MLSENELKIIAHLRRNSRQSLIDIARKTGIPMSTIYDKIKTHYGTTIKRFTSLVDFPALGYNLRANLLVKGRSKELRDFLSSHPHVNSLYHISGAYDYAADCVFRYMGELDSFRERLNELSERNEMHFVTEELRREDFLTSKVDKSTEE